MQKLLSVIIPAYYEEGMIEQAAAEISAVLAGNAINYEIIFVDDGSKDRTWEKIRTVNAQDTHIRGISFSRNFGKEAAMFAGLSAAKYLSTVICSILRKKSSRCTVCGRMVPRWWRQSKLIAVRKVFFTKNAPKLFII